MGIGEGPPTNYMFTEDPETGTGWLDSSPADRRFMMSTGPFTMQAFVDENQNSEPAIGISWDCNMIGISPEQKMNLGILFLVRKRRNSIHKAIHDGPF